MPQCDRSYCSPSSNWLTWGASEIVQRSRELYVAWRRGNAAMRRFSAGFEGLRSKTELPVQVAAVCFRWNISSVEFLLVKTSSGKWTFPKGRLNPGMSASESAAQEAWEEAGASGRIAESHFASYLDTKRAWGHTAAACEVQIVAYLLEVCSTVTPEEDGRCPTWYSAREAKRRLAEGRALSYANTIVKIVDSALECLNKREARPSPILGRHQTRRLAPAR